MASDACIIYHEISVSLRHVTCPIKLYSLIFEFQFSQFWISTFSIVYSRNRACASEIYFSTILVQCIVNSTLIPCGGEKGCGRSLLSRLKPRRCRFDQILNSNTTREATKTRQRKERLLPSSPRSPEHVTEPEIRSRFGCRAGIYLLYEIVPPEFERGGNRETACPTTGRKFDPGRIMTDVDENFDPSVSFGPCVEG